MTGYQTSYEKPEVEWGKKRVSAQNSRKRCLGEWLKERMEASEVISEEDGEKQWWKGPVACE